MIVKINPNWIPGRWRIGVSLDWHTLSSEFLGYDDQGRPQFDTKRSDIGELLYRLKYASDLQVVEDIADTAASYVRQLLPAPFKFAPTLVVPVPPSRHRVRQPVFELASAIAQRLGISVAMDAVVRKAPIPELKEIQDYTQRLDLLRDVHGVDSSKTSGASVLLIDDLFRSGASLNSVANALVDMGGVRDLCALTITRTRSNK